MLAAVLDGAQGPEIDNLRLEQSTHEPLRITDENNSQFSEDRRTPSVGELHWWLRRSGHDDRVSIATAISGGAGMAGRVSSDVRARIEAPRSAGTGVAGIAVLVGRDRWTSTRCTCRSSKTTSTTCPADSTTRTQQPTPTHDSVATTDRAWRRYEARRPGLGSDWVAAEAVGLEVADVCPLQGAGMGRLQHDLGCGSRGECFGPAGCAQAPVVTGGQSVEAGGRLRRRQVVACRLGKLEELSAHHDVHRVDSVVAGVGVAAAIS